jgi:hypothetical protein
MMTNEHVSVVWDQANVARDKRRVILRLVAAFDFYTFNISISTEYKVSYLHDQHQHHATCCIENTSGNTGKRRSTPTLCTSLFELRQQRLVQPFALCDSGTFFRK